MSTLRREAGVWGHPVAPAVVVVRGRLRASVPCRMSTGAKAPTAGGACEKARTRLSVNKSRHRTTAGVEWLCVMIAEEGTDLAVELIGAFDVA